MNLSKSISLARLSNAVAAGTTAITPTAGLDMEGYEGVLFIVPMGAITTGAVTDVKVQQSSDDGATDAYSDLAGSAFNVADSDDNQLVYIDVFRPQKRYVKPVVDRATQNAVVDGIIAIRYGARRLPAEMDTTVAGGLLLISPAEGTA